MSLVERVPPQPLQAPPPPPSPSPEPSLSTSPLPSLPSYVSTDGTTEWALESTTLPACCSNFAPAGTQTKWPLVSVGGDGNLSCSGGGSQTAQEWVDYAAERLHGPYDPVYGLCLSDQGVDGFYKMVSHSMS